MGIVVNQPAANIKFPDLLVQLDVIPAVDLIQLPPKAGTVTPNAAKAVEEIIAQIALSGVKVIFATHDLGQARRLANDVIFLVSGRVAEHSAAEAFFTAPASSDAAAFVRGDLVI